MSRSAGMTSSYTSHPIFADDYVAFQHEVFQAAAYSNASMPVVLPFAETFDLNLNSGSTLTTVKQMIPDVEAIEATDAQSIANAIMNLRYTPKVQDQPLIRFGRAAVASGSGAERWLRRLPGDRPRRPTAHRCRRGDPAIHARAALDRFRGAGRSLMAPLPTAPAPQPPPDLPADPKLSDAMSNYLRTFALWCRKMFQDKLDANAALPGILLQAYNKPPNAPPSVFMLEVSQAGTLALAPAALGSGDLGAPVPIGAGGYLPLSGGSLSGNLTVTDTVFAKAAAGNAAFCVLDSASAAKGYFYWEKSDASTRMTNVAGVNALVLSPNGVDELSAGRDGAAYYRRGRQRHLHGSGRRERVPLFAEWRCRLARRVACVSVPERGWGQQGSDVLGVVRRIDLGCGTTAGNGRCLCIRVSNCWAIKSNQGYFCKAGTAGGFTNIFNINWTGTSSDLDRRHQSRHRHLHLRLSHQEGRRGSPLDLGSRQGSPTDSLHPQGLLRDRRQGGRRAADRRRRHRAVGLRRP